MALSSDTMDSDGNRPTILEGPNGPVVASSGSPISDGQVRAVLEAVRERRTHISR